MRSWVVLVGVAALAIMPAAAGATTAGDAAFGPSPGNPSWAVQPTPPVPGTLSGVSCPTRGACMAVGTAGELAFSARWNGSVWIPLPTARSALSGLNGVSCVSPDNCIAVGSAVGTGPSGVTGQPLILRWNGLAWVQQLGATIPGGVLEAVSCTSADACTAVGLASDPAGYDTLVERWNGRTWTVQATPSATRPAVLNGVSCASRTTCVAVGSANAGTANDQTLALHWDGSTWAAQPTPSATWSSLDAVSCTSGSACTAVGWDRQGGARAERWDGSQWTTQPMPNVPGQDYFVWGVSCTSTTACTASGSLPFPGVSAPLPAAWAWDGTTWTLQPVPVPSGDVGGQLFGISCPAAGVCTAVGDAYPDGRVAGDYILAERYS